MEIGTKPSAPLSSSSTKRPGARDAADAALELRADALGKPGGDQPVDGVALRRHGAPLGDRDLAGDALEPLLVRGAQAARAEAESCDQRAMHEQVGIAADRRGEVDVAAKVQPEMADVLDRIFRLALRAQDHLVDEERVRRVGDASKARG